MDFDRVFIKWFGIWHLQGEIIQHSIKGSSFKVRLELADILSSSLCRILLQAIH